MHRWQVPLDSFLEVVVSEEFLDSLPGELVVLSWWSCMVIGDYSDLSISRSGSA